MKWLTLSLSSLPLIAVQTDSVIQQYQNLKSKVSTFARNQDILKFNELRSQILRRIVMLDRFYQRFYLDQTINLFHMLKIKLQRVIFTSDNIDNGTIQFSVINSQRDGKDTHAQNQSLFDVIGVANGQKDDDPLFVNSNISHTSNSQNTKNLRSHHQQQQQKHKISVSSSSLSAISGPVNSNHISIRTQSQNPYQKQKEFISNKIKSQFSNNDGFSTYKQHKVFPEKNGDNNQNKNKEEMNINIISIPKKKMTQPLPSTYPNINSSFNQNQNQSNNRKDFKKKSNILNNNLNKSKDKINISDYIAKNYNQNQKSQTPSLKSTQKQHIDKNKQKSRQKVELINSHSQINSYSIKSSGIQYKHKYNNNSKNINKSSSNSKYFPKKGQKLKTQPNQQIYQQNQDQMSGSNLSKNSYELKGSNIHPIQNNNDFRFTIKMTKDQYKKLLEMKKNYIINGQDQYQNQNYNKK